MKKFTDILFWIFTLIVGIYILYQKGYILKNYEDISVKSAYNQMLTDANITLLDVRTPNELKSDGALKNHILVPLQILEQNLDKLEKYKNTKIFIYCRSGNRSVTAARTLSNAGFKSYNVQGGIIEWKEKKLPLQ